MASRSSLANARLFIATVNVVLGDIENVEDREVVAAKVAIMWHAHGLSEALDEIERLAAAARRPRA